MKDVRVIAAQGATLRGPCKIKLTKAQHEPRKHILGGKYPRGGVFDLDGGQALNFKLGETLQIELAGTERLNRSVFEWDEPETANSEPAKQSDASSDKSDTPPEGSGDQNVAGNTITPVSGSDTVSASGDDKVAGSED